LSKLASVDDWWDLSVEEREAFVSAHERRPQVVSGATVRSLEVRPEDLQGETVCVPEERASDAVFRPSHYARWPVEPVSFIAYNGLDFLTGNCVKYLMRHDAKNGIEDLYKARRYLDMLISLEQRKAAGEDFKVAPL